MKRLKGLSTRRVRDYDYSQPGVHHVVLETKGDAEILGSCTEGITTLSDAGRAFLDELGMALQNFPCIRIDGINMGPSTADLKIVISDWRNRHDVPEIGSDEWKYYRRVMTLPMFMGYLKMNSGLRINTLGGTPGGAVWTRRYRARVVADEEESKRLTVELDEKWRHVVVMPKQRSKAKPDSSLTDVLALRFDAAGSGSGKSEAFGMDSELLRDTMFLGRVLLLTGTQRVARNRKTSRSGKTVAGGSGGMAGRSGPSVRSLGQDQIFLTR
jgi:hypothetical protein